MRDGKGDHFLAMRYFVPDGISQVFVLNLDHVAMRRSWERRGEQKFRHLHDHSHSTDQRRAKLATADADLKLSRADRVISILPAISAEL